MIANSGCIMSFKIGFLIFGTWYLVIEFNILILKSWLLLGDFSIAVSSCSRYSGGVNRVLSWYWSSGDSVWDCEIEASVSYLISYAYLEYLYEILLLSHSDQIYFCIAFKLGKHESTSMNSKYFSRLLHSFLNLINRKHFMSLV